MAHEEDWTDVEVFADRLQAAGDPRGELLALELASERATSSEEARRLNREAQRIRDAHHELVWPSAVALTSVHMRAGFVVSAGHEAIRKHAIPLELLLSLRDISVKRPLESCAPLLEEGCRRGLRLEGLGHWAKHADVPERVPAQLGSLRRFIEYDAQAPALEWISFSTPVRDVELLTKLAKLRSCSFRAPLSEAELRSLAPLRLEQLTLYEQPVPASLGAWFGDTLTRVRLSGCGGSLAPLSRLSRLEELTLEGDVMADAVADLHALTQLEDLTLPRLDEEGLATLARLNLRSLTIGEMSAALVRRLPILQKLEALTIRQLEGCLDVSVLAELPHLRQLVVPGALFGELRLPPGFERLVLSRAIGAVPITGEVASLSLFDCDLREVPSSLLESVRDLRFVWFDDRQDQALAELPRLVPQLERLSLTNYREEWTWPEAPEVLSALPQLRALDLEDETVEALAERARMFPDLCVLGSDWPRSCGATL